MSHKKCIISLFDCLLSISATEKQISEPFFSSENWDPYENIEYRTISMQIQGAELFVKPNLVPKETSSFSYWPEVVLRALEWSCEGLTGTWLAISHTVRPWGAPSCPNQLSGVIQASLGNKRTIWLCWNHFKSKWIWTCVFQSPILFCKYLSSLKLLRNDFVFRIYRWISVLGRKKLFGNPFLGCWDISQRIKYNSNYTFFMGHPLLKEKVQDRSR